MFNPRQRGGRGTPVGDIDKVTHTHTHTQRTDWRSNRREDESVQLRVQHLRKTLPLFCNGSFCASDRQETGLYRMNELINRRLFETKHDTIITKIKLQIRYIQLDFSPSVHFRQIVATRSDFWDSADRWRRYEKTVLC